MPDNDMGTAHGRVKITVEDRQLTLLADRLAKMQKSMDKMSRNMDKFAAALTGTEKASDRASKSYDRAARTQAKTNRAFLKTSKSVRSFSKDIGDTAEDVAKLIQGLNKMRGTLAPLEKAAKVLTQFQRAGGSLSGFAQALGNVNREAGQLARTVNGLTLQWNQHNKALQGLRGGLIAGAAGFSIFWNQGILGKNRAIAQMPVVAQHMNRMTQAMRLFGTVAPIAAAAAAGPWAIGMAKAAAANRKFHTGLEGVLGRLDSFDSRMGVVTNRVREFVTHMDKAGNTAQAKGRVIGKAIKDVYDGANGFPKAAQQVLTGVALMNAGVQGLISRFAWLGRIPKYVLLPLIAAIGAGPAALELFGKALTGVSNILMGLLDGLKQLSGGLLALPGIIAGIAAAGTTLFSVFSGIGDLFGDIFDAKDAEEMAKALAALPPHLRSLGLLAREVKDRWKQFQTVLQERAFVGFEGQLRPLIDRWLPRMQANMLQVTTSLRSVKDAFVGFLGEAETGRDVNDLYSKTAQTLNNVAAATQPLLAGFRDLGTVGASFASTLSAFLPLLTTRFAGWAKVNRDNGNLMKWMTESVDGARDLVVGLVDVTKAAWTLLTLFKSDSGDNFLERFAKWADELNQKVQKSAATGFLQDLGDAVRNLGMERFNELKDLFGQIVDMLKQVIPFVHDVASAFSDTFMPILEWAMQDIKNFANALDAMGLDSVIGWVLGLVAAFKLIPEVLGPVRNAIQLAWGGVLVFRNSDKIFSALDTALLSVAGALENFGNVGRRAGGAILDMEGGAKRLIGTVKALAVSVGSLAGVIGFAVLQIWDNQQYINDGFKQLNKNVEDAAKNGLKLKDAFAADSGQVGGTVIDQISANLDSMMNNLEATAEKAPGFWRNIQDTLFGGGKRTVDTPIFPMLFSQTEDFNRLQKRTQDAQRAMDKLKELQMAGVDLGAVLRSSDAEYNKFVQTQLQGVENGNEAAAALQAQRDQIKGLEADFKRLGPGGTELSEGIRKIGEAAGDTTSRLEGLKQILEGLGIIKTDSLDAAFAYAESIRELGDSVMELKSKGINFSDAIGADGKSFNTASEGANELYNILKPLGDQFLANVAAGANAQTEYAKFEQQLANLSAATGISIETLKALGEQVGLAPKVVGFSVQLEGKEQVIQDLGEVLLAAQSKLGQGVEVPVQVENPQAFSDKINELLGRDATSASGTNLIIKPGLNQADLNKISQQLANFGVSIPGFAPAAPVQAKIAPSTAETGNINQNGISEPERAAADGTADTARDTMEQFEKDLQASIDRANDASRSGGEAFTHDFAEGILSNKDEVVRAADEVAQAARDRMPGSPAKKGPLSGSGWSGISGKAFSSDFGWGISQNAGVAAKAASDMAGGVAGALGQGQGIEAAGEFLGQLSRLVDFGARITEVIGKVAETVFGIAKFVSDPMGKGTFFGKHPGFRRDPALSDDMLAKRRADAAQGRISSALGSGRRDTSWYDPQTGAAKVNVGDLPANAGQQDIANYIIDKAMSQGYSRQQANQFLIQAVGESGLRPDASNPNGWYGIFQFDKPTWEGAGGGNMTDAKTNIDNYFKLAEQRGLTPQNFTSGSQLGTQVSIGGPWHPDNAALGHLDNATANAQKFIDAYQSGVGQTASVSGGIPGIPSMPGNLSGSKLRPGEGVEAGLEPQAAMVAALLSNMFPGITDIGGRQERTGPQMHPNGRALDVMTGQNADLGDQIAAFIKANYQQLGIQSYIWRDQGLNLVANEGGGPGTTYTAGGHGGPSGTDPNSHVHIQFADGGKVDIGPNGTNINLPMSIADKYKDQFGLPMAPEDTPPRPEEFVTRDANGNLIATHQGTGAMPGEKLNPLTGKPWTKEESDAFYNDPRSAIQYDISGLQPGDQDIPGVSNKTQDEMLKELQAQTPLLQESINVAKSPDATDAQRADALSNLQAEIDRQNTMDTATSRMTAQGLESIKSDVMQEFGFSEQENPIDQASQIAGSMASIAGDVFKVMDSVIQSIGATKDLTEMAIRGPSNTEDIYNMIDRIQKYIQLGADIAGAVSSISGAIGSIVGAAGGADPSGGASGAATVIQGISQIAGLVQSAFETVNAVIDLGQEAYRIIGSYVGDFLGFLVGGPGGKLEGDVKFLLDEVNGNLMAYSRDNPLDKREHPIPGQDQDPNARAQGIGQINVIGGYGQDPRDLTRQMMWQVNTSQFAGVGNG